MSPSIFLMSNVNRWALCSVPALSTTPRTSPNLARTALVYCPSRVSNGLLRTRPNNAMKQSPLVFEVASGPAAAKACSSGREFTRRTRGAAYGGPLGARAPALGLRLREGGEGPQVALEDRAPVQVLRRLGIPQHPKSLPPGAVAEELLHLLSPRRPDPESMIPPGHAKGRSPGPAGVGWVPALSPAPVVAKQVGPAPSAIGVRGRAGRALALLCRRLRPTSAPILGEGWLRAVRRRGAWAAGGRVSVHDEVEPRRAPVYGAQVREAFA